MGLALLLNGRPYRAARLALGDCGGEHDRGEGTWRVVVPAELILPVLLALDD